MKTIIKIILATTALVSSLAFAQSWKEVKSVDSMTGVDSGFSSLTSKNHQPVGMTGQSVGAQIRVFTTVEKDEYPALIVFNGKTQPLSFNKRGNCPLGSCNMLVKLDGGSVEYIGLYEGTDRDGRAQVYIDDKEFVERLRKAKTIQIRIHFFKAPHGEFHFSAK